MVTHSTNLAWEIPWLSSKDSACNACNAREVGLISRLGRGRFLLEEEMVTHSTNLAWEIPWTKEPDGL